MRAAIACGIWLETNCVTAVPIHSKVCNNFARSHPKAAIAEKSYK